VPLLGQAVDVFPRGTPQTVDNWLHCPRHVGSARGLSCAGRSADSRLDPSIDRDGISILGGEPFLPPEGLWALVQELRVRNCSHILVYSGYTHERVQRMALVVPR